MNRSDTTPVHAAVLTGPGTYELQEFPRPTLPDGWLDSPYLDEASACSLRDAEISVSGG
jgi:hypothetical protein